MPSKVIAVLDFTLLCFGDTICCTKPHTKPHREPFYTMNTDAFLAKRPLLTLQIAGWTAYALSDHIGHLMFGSNHFIASFASGLFAMLLTGLLAMVNHRMAQQKALLRGTVFLVILFLTAMLWNKVFRILHGHNSLQEVLNYSLQQWFSGTSLAFYLFVAWTGFYLSSKYFLAHREQQLALNQALLTTKQAQLQTLRYQLNPHFLFNVLNSIDVSVLAGDNKTSHQMLQNLSRFLRNSLEYGEQALIPLKQEMQVIADFISIEQIRFQDAIEITIKVEPDCEEALLPPMLLQPLMENAIKFAWSQTEQGEVKVLAYKQDQQLCVRVVNSRADDYSEGLKTGTGTGLRNTAERLKVTYGDDAKLSAIEFPEGYQVEILLPWVNQLD